MRTLMFLAAVMAAGCCVDPGPSVDHTAVDGSGNAEGCLEPFMPRQSCVIADTGTTCLGSRLLADGSRGCCLTVQPDPGTTEALVLWAECAP